jgi:hypothetical protein
LVSLEVSGGDEDFVLVAALVFVDEPVHWGVAVLVRVSAWVLWLPAFFAVEVTR